MDLGHRHTEAPANEEDLQAFFVVGADESLTIFVGLRQKRVALVGICEHLSHAEIVALLEEVLAYVRDPDNTPERGRHA